MAVNTVVATVQALTGTVIARDVDGNSRVLAVGDAVYAGEEVIPLQGASVDLQAMEGGVLSLGEGQQVLVGEALADSGRADNPEIPTAEEVIAALERGESLDALIAPPAAGLEGGDSDGGGFVRVARINEPVEPINYTFPENVFGRPDALGETVAVPGGETADTVVPPGQPPVEPPVEPPPPVTANPTLTVSVSVAAGYGYDDANDAAAGDVVFEVSHTLNLDGLDPALASAIVYSIVGGDTAYLALAQDGAGNWVVVLTEAGAAAIRAGVVDGNQLNVIVEGTIELVDLPDLVDTDNAFAPVPEPGIVEPPVEADLFASAHVVGASPAIGTMANVHGLKDTGAQSAAVSYGEGFFAVDHQGNNNPSAIDFIEALLFEFREPTDTAVFQIEGAINGGSYHLYDADGVRIGEARDLAADVNEDGFLELSGETFSYIAFQGGSTGSGGSGDRSEFSVRPVDLSVQVGEGDDADFYPAGGDEALVADSVETLEEADDFGANFLTVDSDQDIFVVAEGGQGTTDDPARFVIQGFSLESDNGAAQITLGELLSSASQETIDQYLMAESQGEDTVLHISSGGMLGTDTGGADYAITLEGVSMDGFDSSYDFIQTLIENGHLTIDQ
ncbi:MULTISPECIES: retention module-containing protein [unclassified Thioalkalivibrio]|uniref:retention module-containing protein n=1 Tax=unclassified Thioalkalivibrio TaxID=2621013 RepID=UPI00035FC5AD|nr:MULTISPECIES: retention module-containing protein [unclassified Thioalkalivibrio]